MRNLKKFLALVLAMVMAFSLMLSASAATFDDKHFSDTDKVTQEFKEAVAVLTGLDVIKGDGDGDIKDIRPGSPITRAEAAALVYRIATGDVNDKQVAMYSDYSNFKDVKPRTANDDGDWFAGYVGYCQNAGIIKGTTPTTFNPYGNVTGYEVLAMILRAVGYGKNNEFTGGSWQVNVASLGKTKHITDSITSSHLNYTLNMNATREIVAELLFRGSLIKQVKWTPGLGYVEYINGQQDPTSSLAAEVFALNREGWRNGEWGVPELVWTAGLNPTSTPRRDVAVLKADYKETFHEEKRECDVAELMGFTTTKDYILFVNSDVVSSTSDAWDNRVTSNYHVVATDAVTKVGGYGRVTEIYTEADMNEQYPFHNWESYWASESGKVQYAVTAPKDTIVMVDTIVAKVMNVSKCVKDAAGHVITPARLTVALYDAATKNSPNTRVISKAAGSDKEWDYAIGDVLSLQGPTNAKAQGEAAAYSTQVLPGTRADILYEGSDVVNIKKMEGVSGKQTTVIRNTNQHEVDGEKKFDDLTLKLDKALDNINTTYTWYYDDYGYVQAIDEGRANYGVITSIYASFGQGETQTNGTAKAVATVQFSNGDEETVEIDRFLVKDGTATTLAATMIGKTPDATMSSADSLELWPMYDVEGKKPLNSDATSGLDLPLINVDNKVTQQGFLYVAPAAISNEQSNRDTTNDEDYHGVLHDNLFKFVKVANDQTVAVEVSGNGNGTNNIYADNHSALTSSTVNPNLAGYSGKVWKNLGFVTTTHNATGPVAWIDDDTQIIVRNPDTNKLAVYNGVSSLPADVNLVVSTGTVVDDNFKNEIDWADPDGDGRAEVLYVTGKIDGQTTYGLFYYNDGEAVWNGTVGTAKGFLNGEETTLTFANKADYDEIVGNTNTYLGHLYAVQQQQGVVTAVLEKNRLMNGTASAVWTKQLLVKNNGNGDTDSKGNTLPNNTDWNLSASDGYMLQSSLVNTGIRIKTTDTTLTGGTFVLGDTDPRNGNTYNTNTKAIYYRDTNVVSNQTYQLRWVPEIVGSTGTVEVYIDGAGTPANANGVINAADLVATYYVNVGTKVWGLGSGVTFGPDALEYLNRYNFNDVTIVFDGTGAANARTVREIYVATDPDDTTNNPSNPATVGPYAGTVRLTPQSSITGGSKLTKDNYVKSQPAGAYMCTTADLSYGQDIGAGNLSKTVYFVFKTDGIFFNTATLNIYNNDGLLVHTESMPDTAGAGAYNNSHYFYVYMGAGGALNLNLPAGRYTYTITTTPNAAAGKTAVLTEGGSGSFTIPTP